MQAITPLDRTSPTPLYYQLLQLLRDQLQSGMWEAGDAFPKEQELCDMYDVSRTTARAALHDLVRAGLLYRERGRGTFVARRPASERYVQGLGGFHREMTSRGHEVASDVLAQERGAASEEVARALRIPLGTSVIQVTRLRRVDGEPVVWGHTYLPYALCPDVLEAELRTQSLYAYLERHHGFRPAASRRIVRARPLPTQPATLLHAPEGSCSLYVESCARLADGTPLAYDVSWFRGDRATFEVEVVGEERG